MIIGNGMIARAFRKYAESNEILVFASGVSNSSETDIKQFDRERALLLNALGKHRHSLFLYFSTCSLDDPDSANTDYVSHKRKMENLIKSAHRRFLILRLPQVVGRTENKSTLVNYLCNCIREGRHFFIWSRASRHIIDVDDAAAIAGIIIDRALFVNQTVNIAPGPAPVIEVVRILERIVRKRANYSMLDKGASYEVDTRDIEPIARELNIRFQDGYLEAVLHKYYSNQMSLS